MSRAKTISHALILGPIMGLAGLLGIGPAAAQPPAQSPDPLRVVVTIPPLAGLVGPLTPKGSEVRCLIPPGRSEHGYELTPQDVAALGRADVVVLVGLGLEPQVAKVTEKVAASKDRPPLRVVDLGKVLGLEKDGAVHDHHGHDHEHEHAGVDVHVWLDPVLVKQALPAIAGALKETGKLGAFDLDAARAALEARVDEIDAAYRLRAGAFSSKIIVTHHAAFGRLAARYGLEVAEVVRPVEGGELEPARMAQVVGAIREKGVRAIFVEPAFDRLGAERIAQAAGAAVGTLDPLGDGDWFLMMRRNLDELEKYLGVPGKKENAASPAP